MPTLLTPPDLQMILDWNDAPVLLRGVASTRFASRAWSEEQKTLIRKVFGCPPLPTNTRGITGIWFRDLVEFPEYQTAYSHGFAYLSADDSFYEQVGMILATTRAVTDLIRRHTPLNAVDLSKRVYRWGRAIVAAANIKLDNSTIDALYTASETLEAEAHKCQK